MELELTHHAMEDLRSISRYTMRRWGKEQVRGSSIDSASMKRQLAELNTKEVKYLIESSVKYYQSSAESTYKAMLNVLDDIENVLETVGEDGLPLILELDKYANDLCFHDICDSISFWKDELTK